MNEAQNKPFYKTLDDYIKVLNADGVTQKTLNSYGWHINKIDQVQKTFLDFAKTARKPIADLGVGFGYSTKALLETSQVDIIANDLCQEHLDSLLQNVTDESQRSRLITKQGDALGLDFKENSLDGIQAIRWFYFLRPSDIRRSFNIFFKWLSPGGKLFINAFSPYMTKLFGPFLPIYHERKVRNEEWPGAMEADNVCWLKSGIAQDHGYVFDKDVFAREAKLAGFEVEYCDYYPHPEERSRESGKELVGVIAVKPF